MRARERASEEHASVIITPPSADAGRPWRDRATAARSAATCRCDADAPSSRSSASAAAGLPSAPPAARRRPCARPRRGGSVCWPSASRPSNFTWPSNGRSSSAGSSTCTRWPRTPPRGVVPDHRLDVVQRIEPVGDQHDRAVRRQRQQRRQAGRRACRCAPRRTASRRCGAPRRGPRSAACPSPARRRARRHRPAGSPAPSVISSARTALVSMFLQRGVLHRRRGIAPQPDAGRGLPFGLAHEQMPAARALAPVDLAGAVAVAIGPVLPEGIALADAPPAVHALDHGRGHAIGRHHQRRQRAGQFQRAVKGRGDAMYVAIGSRALRAMPDGWASSTRYANRAHI